MNCQLKDLGEIITGNTPSKKENSYYETKDIPFIKPDVLADNELIIKTPSDYLSEKARNKARIVNKGSILVTCIGSIGKIGVCQGECAFNQQINTIVPNDKVRSDYLAYNLIYNKQRLIDIANCSVVPIINKKQFSEFSIKVDLNKETQQKIVAKLDNLNLAIDKCKSLLELHDELIKSKFYEMFGDPVNNTKNFTIELFDKFINFMTSGSRGWAKYVNENGSEWFITIKNVKDGKISLENMQSINAPDNVEAKRTKVQKDDLLISITADLGRTGIVTDEIANHGAYINQHLVCIRYDRTVLNPVFIAYYLQSPAGRIQFESKNQNTVKAGLNFNAIKELKIMLPPLQLQTQFAQYVETVESSKTKIKELQSRIEYLKASYMQEFFA